jgi:hypothetical protein
MFCAEQNRTLQDSDSTCARVVGRVSNIFCLSVNCAGKKFCDNGIDLTQRMYQHQCTQRLSGMFSSMEMGI